MKLNPAHSFGVDGSNDNDVNQSANPLDLLTEDIISLSEAAREVSVHVATIHRWRQRGVGGVHLETLRVGGKILTSRPALTRFLLATQN